MLAVVALLLLGYLSQLFSPISSVLRLFEIASLSFPSTFVASLWDRACKGSVSRNKSQPDEGRSGVGGKGEGRVNQRGSDEHTV